MTEVTLLNRDSIEPILKPGNYVTVEPRKKYGIYQVPRTQAPEWLPPVYVNMASYTSTLAAFTDTGNPTTIATRITDLDMPKSNLAQYWLVAVDDVTFQVSQPAAVGRFVNRNGTVRFGIETDKSCKQGAYGNLPQVFVYEDVTPTTITVTPKYFRASAYARFMAFGFRYILEKSTVDPDEVPSLVIRVEGS